MIGRPIERSARHRVRRGNALRLMQSNVRRTPATHDVALNLAWEAGYDVLLVQEPWTELNKHQRKLTKTHPGFDTFSPVEDWLEEANRPRVLTYIRKRKSLRAHHVRPFTTPYCCMVEVNGILLANVYRQPGYPPGVLEGLEKWTPGPNTVVAGDFNALHWTWQPGHGRHASPGQRLADWIEQVGLVVENPEEPTHEAGNTIDLVLSNIPGTETLVEPRLATGSDHHTVVTTVPCKPTPAPTTGRLTIPVEKYSDFYQLVQKTIWTVREAAETPEDLEDLAKDLTDLLTTAMRAVGHTRGVAGRKTTWWNDACRRARTELAQATRGGDPTQVKLTRKTLGHTVTQAKKAYWTRRIISASKETEMYEMASWYKATDTHRSPPLVDKEQPITAPIDKATHLRDSILYRFSADEDIQNPWEGEPPERGLPWAPDVTPEEARACCIKTGNTAPGLDGITVNLLSFVWDLVGPRITLLYDRSLKLGYHPRVFKGAEVVMIPKPGKTNYTSYRSYRPIALISCLSKGLERLVAKRMSETALLEGLLNPQHFGALPKRSAVDLTAALTHDLEEALDRGLEGILLTMDVQGAFDSVLPNRNAKRLREQGWPDNLVRWVLDFSTGRSVRVRFEGAITGDKPLVCGLPQGSPVSPILFMLYMQPFLTRRKAHRRFCYADDAALLEIGRTTEEAATALSLELEDALQWGRDNAVAFAPDKYELLHVTRKRDRSVPLIRVDGAPIRPKKVLRWLGVYFDSKLTFRQHVETWGSRAHKAAAHLRGLNRVMAGAPPRLTALAANACVMPVATYGAETWWQGPTKPGTKDPTKMVKTRQDALVGIIEKTVKVAARAVLPVWKTTPVPVLHRESGLPPAEVILEQYRLRAAMRLKTLDELHPLVQRLQARPNRGTGGRPSRTGGQLTRDTRLRRMNSLLGPCERPRLWPTNYAPDLRTVLATEHVRLAGRDDQLALCSKEVGKERHRAWEQAMEKDAIAIYSDGSENNGITAWAFVAYQNGEEIASGRGRLREAHVYDGEIRGASEGVVWASANYGRLGAPAVYSYIDSTSVIWGIYGNTPNSSQGEFLRFRHNQGKLTGVRKEVRWSPGHVGIKGNERADQLAGELTTTDPWVEAEEDGLTATVSWRRSEFARKKKALLDSWWVASRPYKYQRWRVKAVRRPPELALPRPTLHRLIAERCGHGDFVEYHNRFGHPKPELRCRCGMPKSNGHFARCPLARIFFPDWVRKDRELEDLLGDKGIAAFHSLVTEAKIYEDGAIEEAGDEGDAPSPRQPVYGPGRSSQLEYHLGSPSRGREKRRQPRDTHICKHPCFCFRTISLL